MLPENNRRTARFVHNHAELASLCFGQICRKRRRDRQKRCASRQTWPVRPHGVAECERVPGQPGAAQYPVHPINRRQNSGGRCRRLQGPRHRRHRSRVRQPARAAQGTTASRNFSKPQHSPCPVALRPNARPHRSVRVARSASACCRCARACSAVRGLHNWARGQPSRRDACSRCAPTPRRCSSCGQPRQAATSRPTRPASASPR